MHDVFISHASEDKDLVARPLAMALRQAGLDVWYDEFSLNVGESLLASVQRGLTESRFGVVVFSPHFFSKVWPQAELQGLFAQEIANRANSRILPVWHGVDAAYMAMHAPVVADRVALRMTDGLEQVAKRIQERVRADIIQRAATWARRVPTSYEVKGTVEVKVRGRVRFE